MSIPNTTPTPNIIFNGLMAKMTDTEFRVVMLVVRKTLGWEMDPNTGMRKKEDWISYWQLKKGTGRGYTALAQAINSCVEKGWIEARDKEGNLLNKKNKRIGKKIFYRLGKEILLKDDGKKVLVKEYKPFQKAKRLNPTSSDSVITESVITESEAYKRKTYTKEKQYKRMSAKADNIFSFKKKLDEMKKDKRKHINIIALYWQYKAIQPQNNEQYQALLKRELKAARDLVGFTKDRIIEVMDWLDRENNFKWTLETILKYITEDLGNIEPIKGR